MSIAYCARNCWAAARVSGVAGVCRARETATNDLFRRVCRPGLCRPFLNLRLCGDRESQTRFDYREDRFDLCERPCVTRMRPGKAERISGQRDAARGRSFRKVRGADERSDHSQASRDTELNLLISPAVRERASERRDGEIGGSVAVSDRLNEARRYESQRREKSHMPLDLALGERDVVEGRDPALSYIVHPDARLRDGRQQRLDRLRIKIGLGRWLPGDALSRAGVQRAERQRSDWSQRPDDRPPDNISGISKIKWLVRLTAEAPASSIRANTRCSNVAYSCIRWLA
jgi:hypothetical protein